MADFYGSKNGESFWPDARVAPAPPMPEIKPEPAPAPAATQNTTAVQPLVIVPYVSQMQPLYQYTPEAMRAMYGNNVNEKAFLDDLDSYDAYDEAPVAAPVAKKRSRANAMAIVGLLLGLVTVAFMVLGYFGFLPAAILPYLCIYGDATVANVIMTDLIESIMNIPPFVFMEILVPGAIALSVLFTVITLLTNLFSVAARRYPIFGKVTAWLAFIFAAVAVVYLFIAARADVQIGAYVLVGLTLIIAIFCTAGRRK
ncbi:MAG: hypothetical protein IJ735_04795 [Clostridia bacterium]|nr:hypothetical protein [Clostridia bacterium]